MSDHAADRSFLPPEPGTVLNGHFLTRAEALRLSRLDEGSLLSMRGLVRLDGPLGEVYPAFQFSPDGRLLEALRWVVEHLAPVMGGESLAAFLMAPHPGLANRSPSTWLREGRATDAVLTAAGAAGPLAA